MVNLFDGSFTYNIPLLDIPNGYPITLSYHSSEINTEALASWVGLGWTLNPGAINRIKRGFPDEFKGEAVTYHTRMPPNWTATAYLGGGVELFGGELYETGLSLGNSIRYNNYKGVGRALHGGVSLAGTANMNFTYSEGRFGFSGSLNPIGFLQRMNKKSSDNKEEDPDKQKWEKMSEQEKEAWISKKAYEKLVEPKKGMTGSTFSFSTETPRSFPVPSEEYSGIGLHMKFDLGINFLPLPIDPELSLSGSFVQQNYSEKKDSLAYGYLNMENADTAGIMDYRVENEKSYEKRDRILGIPLPNNDVFTLTGEAMGGSFRAYRSEFGHYTKPYSSSETITADIGADLNLASIVTPVGTSNLEYTLGGNIGGDHSEINIGNWDLDYRGDANSYKFVDETSFSGKSDEKFVVRYSGDLTGNFNQTGNNDQAVRADLDSGLLNASIVIKQDEFALNDSGFHDGKMTQRNLRSSYIGMNFNQDFDLLANNDVRYKVYQRNLWIKDERSDSWVDYNVSRSTHYGANSIGEVYTFNSDGATYVYGLPIYTRNEKQLQFSLKKEEYTLDEGLIARGVSNNLDSTAERKFGYESDTPYSTQLLLTQITSSDYIDRTFNGLTPDDFGSYTRFNYTRIAGGETYEWYKYRSPYDGLSFGYGSLSDPSDDMGSFVYGEKELYYLHSIASKTHVAIFTLEDRDDGLSSSAQSSSLNHIINPSGGGGIRLKKLTRIDLYSLEDCNEIGESPSMAGVYEPKNGAAPINTVRFEYDYSLSNNISNSIGTGDNKGKLKLKKVWFEYEGKFTSKISPYIFDYDYPNVNYPPPYSSFQDYGSGLNQNPDYSVLNTDRWGNYRDFNDLKTKFGDLAQFYPYLDQNPSTSFDPAAWVLKRIILPSGGEIHIQYQQNDNQYVQNKRAMLMVPLSSSTTSSEGNISKKYIIDISKIGLSPPTITSDIVDDLFKPMNGNKEENRLYFNFLYSLVGNEVPNYQSINSEYIEGFARISCYGIDQNNNVFFVFGKDSSACNDPNNLHSRLIEHESEFNAREMPKKVCEDFYNFNRQGKITHDSNALNPENDGESLMRTTISVAMQAAGLADKCMHIKPEMSYVRLQVPYTMAKRGGGVRVKRLLMYDSGAETTGLPSLFGNEYIYKTPLDPNNPESPLISSGVATNEPATGRRESPLVYPIDKESQSGIQAILYGEDIYGNEAPLGESLLPSPSIGYSRVTVSNIHKGKTSTGYEVYEFNTCKDFPFQTKFTTVDRRLDVPYGVGGGAGYGGVGLSGSYSRVAPHLTQGYAFIANNMHGQPKSIQKYAQGSNLPVLEEIYEYYRPGSSVDVMDENFNVSSSVVGKVSELLAGMNQVDELTVGGSFGLDFTFPIWVTWPMPFPYPIPGVILSGLNLGFNYNESILRTHVTTKIINYSALLKKVIRINDGVRNITENLVFDRYTGIPAVVQSYDDFDNKYINQEFKASWKYPNMRAKAFNERMTAGRGISGKFQPCEIKLDNLGELNKFIAGDLIKLHNFSQCPDKNVLYHIERVDADRLCIVKSALSECEIDWGRGHDFLSVEIIRSGYTNQMNTSMGNLVMHHDETGEPYVNSENVDDITNVLSAFAIAFKDDWPYEENIYTSGIETTSFELNPFENGFAGRWRPYQQFVCRDSVSSGRNFESGKFNLELFEWNDPAYFPPQKWLRTSTITHFSPNGDQIENKNILAIHSTVKYGYNHTVPILVAQNAEKKTVAFESFEKSYPTDNGNVLENNIPINSTAVLTGEVKHTGDSALKLKVNQRNPIGKIKITDKVKKEGILVRLWLNAKDNRNLFDDRVYLVPGTGNLKMNKVANVGEWSLFEFIIDSRILTNIPVADLMVQFDLFILSSEGDDIFGEVYLDDARIQTLQSEMVGYVYDDAQRLVAVLDDQNFAMLYEYNTEGVLVRKLKETIEGIKTISETQYNTKGISRNE